MNILQRPTLVLNKSWVPVNTVPVQEAIKMVYGEWLGKDGKYHPKAAILDVETWQTYDWAAWSLLPLRDFDAAVHDAHAAYRAPEIIITARYQKIPLNQLNFNRKNVFRRDEDTCQYCGNRERRLTWDHVVPRCQGGKSSWENVVVACFPCNQRKAGRTPEQAGMALLRKPQRPGLEVIGRANHKIRSWEVFFGRSVSSIR